MSIVKSTYEALPIKCHGSPYGPHHDTRLTTWAEVQIPDIRFDEIISGYHRDKYYY